jgi:hypothetical protein
MGQVQQVWLIPVLAALLRMAEELRKPLKGGKKSRRDRWFGLEGRPDFPDFRDWWHRHGKEDAGGHDLQTREDAVAAFEDWLSTRSSGLGS